MSEIFDFLKKTGDKQTDYATVSPDAVASESAKQAAPIEEEEIKPPVPETGAADIEVYSADGLSLATQANEELRNILDPLTLGGEQFRLLRTKLGLMQKQRGIKAILVTSSIPDEGKTFTASGLAGVFAQEPGKRVLLIDADMRKPKSGRNLGLNGSFGDSGLSAILAGRQEFNRGLLKFSNPAFCFMPAGPLPTNPSELLSSQSLERLLKTAAACFDWIILDSPPVLGLSDTSLLAPLCDAVLLVVRAGFTSSKLVLNTTNQIGRDRICGIVLNRQKQVHSSRYYYHYYYRGSKSEK